MKTDILCLDIGSTFVKGARLRMVGGQPVLAAQVREPTTRDHVARAAGRAVARLSGADPDLGWPESPAGPIHAASSAKGGLQIFAVGIVPDLTLKAALLAACSAGGRVTGRTAYRLTSREIRSLEETPPDVVLLTGGTDGGNERFNRENAGALAQSAFDGIVLFAGNACQRDEMRRMLAGKHLVVTDNLMPEVGRLNVEPARRAIRDLFLDRIAAGKGLADVAARCAAPVRPTPAAVFDLVAAMDDRPAWRDFAMVDIGGATTDVYSAVDAMPPESGRVLRGLVEPRVMRTVEGDLGLRISAAAAVASDPDFFRRRADAASVPFERFEAHIESLAARTAFVPAAGTEEARFDEWLAERCLRQALLRHAGRIEEHATPAGRVVVQRGKDLGGIGRLVCGGGYLGAHPDPAGLVRRALAGAAREAESPALLPRVFAVIPDRACVIPAAAALAASAPDAASALVETGNAAAADRADGWIGGVDGQSGGEPRRASRRRATRAVPAAARGMGLDS